MTRGLFRLLDIAMAALFAFGAVVQYNDPDAVRWMAIYGVAAVLSVMVVRGRHLPPAIFFATGAVALVWSGLIVAGGPGAGAYTRMFDAWEMESLAAEEAREATGLLIIAGWMMVLSARARRVGTARTHELDESARHARMK